MSMIFVKNLKKLRTEKGFSQRELAERLYVMDPDGNPLHIYVKTHQTNNGSEIIVENNGPDFNPADDNEPHVALNNIRQRLEMMCKGKLTITPREDGGTVVTVFIPNKIVRKNGTVTPTESAY